MKIARVFPRKTNATPDDSLSFLGGPPDDLPDIDEVHVSATFTYDRDRAETLAESWRHTGVPVYVGGPAYNDRGGEFIPGLYVKHGYVMTSRGCDNNCWFCMVPKREGKIRELEIKDGFNVIDSNLLQCSDAHISAVFDMLKGQKERPIFTGGLEAALLKGWHCIRLREIKARRVYFAYDTPGDYEPLVYAIRLMGVAGFTAQSHSMCCYCLIGYSGDTFDKAESRLRAVAALGLMPFAMLYRDENGLTDHAWRKFQRLWARPESIFNMIKEGYL